MKKVCISAWGDFAAQFTFDYLIDYIIVSLVRTLGEGRGNPLGFLKNARRSNVMLSRCKKGMLVLAQRSFLESPEACETLVGKMAYEWENWTEWSDLIKGEDWLDDWVV